MRVRRAAPRARAVVHPEAGSYLRLLDVCITELKAQGPSKICNESQEEEEEERGRTESEGGSPCVCACV